MKCKIHPKYQVLCEPRCDCPVCWQMWNEKQLKRYFKIHEHSGDPRYIVRFEVGVQAFSVLRDNCAGYAGWYRDRFIHALSNLIEESKKWKSRKA